VCVKYDDSINKLVKNIYICLFVILAHSGKVFKSILSTNVPIIKNKIVVIIAPIKTIANPAFTISPIFIFPVLNTIAFGGVATGNIKAKEAETVAGNIRSNGFIFRATAREASIGSIVLVIAVLDVNSVRKTITKQIDRIKTGIDAPENSLNCEPIKAESPED
jgi:hypothetical protein